MDAEVTPPPPWVSGRDAVCKTRFLRPRLLLALATLVALATLLFVAHRASLRQQPVFALLDTMSDRDLSQRLAARGKLLANPDATAPVLVSIIRRGKTRWHAQILPWLDDIPQLSSRLTRQVRLERNAIEVLQRMGPAAAPAVLRLLPETRYGGRDTAIAILRAYGTEVLPCLNQALHDPRPSIRAGAALTLGKFPSDQLGSLDPVLRAGRDPTSSVRAAALWALGQWQDRVSETLPALAAGLDDHSPEVRIQAATALRPLGPAAEPAVPALRRCLSAYADPVRAEAAQTLGAIGGAGARAAAPDLLLALRQRDGPSSRQAACALVQLEVHSEEAFARLKAFLRERDSTVRSRTADALRGIGSAAQPLVPEILALLENDEPRDDRPALLALRAIQPEAIPQRFRQGRGRLRTAP